jgi:phosphoglycerate dehydrogenase-like enzyme
MMLSVFFPAHRFKNVDLLLARLDRRIRLIHRLEIPVPADYEILVAGRPSSEQLTASPNLHTLVIPFSGLPDTTRTLLADFPHLSVHNIHYNDASTAETAMGLLLAAAKLIVPIDRTFRKHDWTPRYGRSSSAHLDKKTVLILGYGAVGQRIARACRGFGMEVIAIRRNPTSIGPGDIPVHVYGPSALGRLLPQANVLMLSLPLTPDTAGLIGAKELELLPPQALLVNVGRAEVVNEAALYEALRDKKLHGAGLDVWYNYPTDEASRNYTPPSKYPFHELDNVVLSPHRAAHTSESEVQRMIYLAALLNAAARGGPMPNRVDPKAGY